MKKRVLVADDDAAVRESLKQLLEAAGYQVKLAANGQEAVAVLASHRTDLLLLDLEMPKRDGWDVLLQLSDESSPLRVIVITGLADQLDTRLIDGVGAVIEKPLDPPVLLNRIEQVMLEEATARKTALGDIGSASHKQARWFSPKSVPPGSWFRKRAQ